MNIQTDEVEIKPFHAPTESGGRWEPCGKADRQMDHRGQGQRRKL